MGTRDSRFLTRNEGIKISSNIDPQKDLREFLSQIADLILTTDKKQISSQKTIVRLNIFVEEKNIFGIGGLVSIDEACKLTKMVSTYKGRIKNYCVN